MPNTIIADIEANGLSPNKIWMIGILDYYTDEYEYYAHSDVAAGLARLDEADYVIGHNFRGYDAKVIRKLTEGIIDIQNERIIDTLDMSRSQFPNLENHKLETWGEILGYPKLDYKRFDVFHPDMIPYCERDCRLNKHLFDFLKNNEMERQTNKQAVMA